eukprot:s4070_g6.t2
MSPPDMAKNGFEIARLFQGSSYTAMPSTPQRCSRTLKCRPSCTCRYTEGAPKVRLARGVIPATTPRKKWKNIMRKRDRPYRSAMDIKFLEEKEKATVAMADLQAQKDRLEMVLWLNPMSCLLREWEPAPRACSMWEKPCSATSCP